MQNEILKKLAELANKLDTSGFYSEADAIDEIIKSAWGNWENPVDRMPAGSGAGGLQQVGPYEPNISEFLHYAQRILARNVGTNWGTLRAKISVRNRQMIDKWLTTRINAAIKNAQASKMFSPEGINKYIIEYLNRELSDPKNIDSLKRIVGT